MVYAHSGERQIYSNRLTNVCECSKYALVLLHGVAFAHTYALRLAHQINLCLYC